GDLALGRGGVLSARRDVPRARHDLDDARHPRVDEAYEPERPRLRERDTECHSFRLVARDSGVDERAARDAGPNGRERRNWVDDRPRLAVEPEGRAVRVRNATDRMGRVNGGEARDALTAGDECRSVDQPALDLEPHAVPYVNADHAA